MAAPGIEVSAASWSAVAGPRTSASARIRSTGPSDASTAALPAPVAEAERPPGPARSPLREGRFDLVGPVRTIGGADFQILDQLRNAAHDPSLTWEASQKRVAPGAGRRIDRSRYQEALPTLLEGPAGGDESAASTARLDDDGRVREPAHEPVAARKRAPTGRRIRGQLRDYDRASRRDDRVREALMGPGKEPCVPAAENCHGCQSLAHDGRMRRSVYPHGEPGDHHRPGTSKARADPAGDQAALVRGPAACRPPRQRGWPPGSRATL